MTNLSCNACSCVHNDDNCCCLNGIDVKEVMPVSAVKLAVEAILTKMALLRIILLHLSLIFR